MKKHPGQGYTQIWRSRPQFSTTVEPKTLELLQHQASVWDIKTLGSVVDRIAAEWAAEHPEYEHQVS